MPTRTATRTHPYTCGSCAATHAKWVGRCTSCSAWNALVETSASLAAVAQLGAVQPITELESGAATTVPTGMAEADRCLGGGMVPGSVTLLGGEPGIGKSTFTLQLAAARVRAGGRVLLVSAEESASQVRLRADRLGAVLEDLWLAGDASVEAILAHADRLQPDLLIVDSVQTVHLAADTGSPGSASQVRGCAQRLVVEAKARGMATLLVGHVTKDGSLAGPKLLEHVVDTVLELTGDRHHALRMLRVVKHRFGRTDEVGLFEMRADGLLSVDDPSRLFLADRAPDVAGSVVLPTLEGHRPLLVEVQALVVRATTQHPRRSPRGLDPRRLALLLAVLERRAGVDLGALDVYATVVGGVQVAEPAADLPLALAVVSATTGRQLGDDVVVVGEVGLGGEVRQVPGMERRLQESHRLGFRKAVIPASAPDPPPGLEVVRVGTLSEAVRATGLMPPGT
jgi:DNA repair protein RadA/Sms